MYIYYGTMHSTYIFLGKKWRENSKERDVAELIEESQLLIINFMIHVFDY